MNLGSKSGGSWGDMEVRLMSHGSRANGWCGVKDVRRMNLGNKANELKYKCSQWW